MSPFRLGKPALTDGAVDNTTQSAFGAQYHATFAKDRTALSRAKRAEVEDTAPNTQLFSGAAYAHAYSGKMLGADAPPPGIVRAAAESERGGAAPPLNDAARIKLRRKLQAMNVV